MKDVVEPVLSVAQVQDFLSREFPQVADVYVVEAVGAMTARVRLMPAKRHLRPGGTISGPSMFELADCAAYCAIIAHVGEEALAVTTSASIDFMRKPAAGEPLYAEVELLKLGRGLVVCECRVTSGGRVCARAAMTYSRPRAT